MEKLTWAVGAMYLLLIPGVAAFVWCKRHKGNESSVTISVKAACTTVVVLTALAKLDSSHIYLALIAAGIVLGLVGDVTICAKDGFLFGMIWFALGHIAYIAALLQITQHPLCALPAFLVIYSIVVYIVVRLKKKEGRLYVPILLYAAVIGTMASLALSAVTVQYGPVLLAAATLFVVSDSLLAFGTVVHELDLAQELVCEYCYFIAQSLFAVSIYLL